jgi:hypothetical protein
MKPQVGQALREARTERGIQLNEVERVTKIRLRFLRAMEEDRWDDLPAPANVPGFISAYAKFLGLDEQALVDQYMVRPSRSPGARRSIKPRAIVAAGVVAAIVLALVIVASLGSSGNGGGESKRHGTKAAGGAPTGTQTAPASSVSLALRSTGTVWVCLVDNRDRALVNSETLAPGDARGPFDGRAFEVTFGNGSIDMTVDGEPAKVPHVAEPLGDRITPNGVAKLDPSSEPTCL